jgi:thiamine-phosphate pyrophosphorylase
VVRLVLVTDRRAVADLAAAVAAALSGVPAGGAAVQLREKDLGPAQLLRLAERLLPVCRDAGAPLLVNGRADVVAAVRADGVHLSADGLPVSEARRLLGPGALVGVSCHSPAEVARAHAAGADFAFFGPVWDTPGKTSQGDKALRDAVLAAPIPVFAIGGVTAATARLAIDAGAQGVACIRSVLGAADAALAAAELWKALGRG